MLLIYIASIDRNIIIVLPKCGISTFAFLNRHNINSSIIRKKSTASLSGKIVRQSGVYAYLLSSKILGKDKSTVLSCLQNSAEEELINPPH